MAATDISSILGRLSATVYVTQEVGSLNGFQPTLLTEPVGHLWCG
jgi:hypothetical protein